ncbi:MAG: FAD-binding protein, partial [Gammaproteobacteria bacterium]|nr:FAD-binding protein [Gammaproteobacteria bacterium]
MAVATETNSSSDQLATELVSIVGADAVLTETEALRPFECDGLTAYRELPLMVVLPSSISQVQDVMKACTRRKVPVVTRGAGTGLSGGALP